MAMSSQTFPASQKALWAGRIISALPALFLLVDGVLKLVKPPEVVTATVQLGYPESVIFGLGLVLVISTILYLIPVTSIFGAMLLTGYLGGAVTTHVRIGESPFSVIFPIIIGLLLWFGLYLRVDRLRELVPRSTTAPPVSKIRLWVGRVISGLLVLGMLFSGVMKLIKPTPVVDEFSRLGYPESAAFGIGLLEILCTIIYLIPGTATLGAILLTAYLGGAVATHVRVGDPFIGPVVFGILAWVGLFLRDDRFRHLIPLRS